MHPLHLLPPDVLRNLPELLADRRPRQPEPPALPTYRSEGFAEDLCDGPPAPALPRRLFTSPRC
jgi:hypothetical protein